MRGIVLLLVFLICGCSSRVTPVTQEEVTDSTGSNRLARVDKDVTSFLDVFRGHQSYDFDALIWRTNAGGRWKDHVRISKAAFQGGWLTRRWVSQIHSLDPTNGIAIIKVAEGDAPEGSPSVRYIYSWREWNLLSNREVRLIRICSDPFETYEGSIKPKPR